MGFEDSRIPDALPRTLMNCRYAISSPASRTNSSQASNRLRRVFCASYQKHIRAHSAAPHFRPRSAAGEQGEPWAPCSVIVNIDAEETAGGCLLFCLKTRAPDDSETVALTGQPVYNNANTSPRRPVPETDVRVFRKINTPGGTAEWRVYGEAGSKRRWTSW